MIKICLKTEKWDKKDTVWDFDYKQYLNKPDANKVTTHLYHQHGKGPPEVALKWATLKRNMVLS